jgi:putative transposase
VCLYMAMMDKKDLLVRLKLPGRWPVLGKMKKVHADNAKEFKGAMLKTACDEHDIDLQLRPTKRPHYGAHIERMVGNVNRELHKRKGTTHSSPNVSPDYDPMKEAVFTLAETEMDIVDWIVNVYQVRKHSALPATPLRAWDVGIMGDKTRAGIGLPPMPLDSEKLRLDFLPLETRTIQPYGVEVDVLKFYHDVLNTWIGAPDPEDSTKKRKFIFRYDPRTIRKIWFWDPDIKKYFEIPISDRSWVDITWGEYEENRRRMKAEGLEYNDEQSIRDYSARTKQREKESTEKTRAAQKANRQSRASKVASREAANEAPGSAIYAKTPQSAPMAEQAAAVDPSEDVFSAPVIPFGQ